MNMAYTYFLTALIPFVIALFLCIYVLPKFIKYGLRDYPERYPHEAHRAPLPYPAGVIIVPLIVLYCLYNSLLTPFIIPIIVLALYYFYDDKYRLKAHYGLIIQLMVSVYAVLYGAKITVIGHPFMNTNIDLSTIYGLSAMLSIVWIMGMMNALNFIDGSNNTSVGLSSIGFMVLAILSFMRPELYNDIHHTPVLLANLFFMGITMGMWYHMWSKKAILGDTGSQILGYLLAIMSVISGAKIATTLMVMALPILDTAVIIIRRVLLERTYPWKGDYNHIHHTLSKYIHERYQALIYMLLGLFYGLIAIFINDNSTQIIIVSVSLFVVFITLLSISYAHYKKWL